MLKETSRYKYEKRIKELEKRVDDLRGYRDLAWTIHTAACDLVGKNQSMSMGWLLAQYWKVVK